MTTPLISVIVPVYRVEKYLERCVKSILSQTYKNNTAQGNQSHTSDLDQDKNNKLACQSPVSCRNNCHKPCYTYTCGCGKHGICKRCVVSGCRTKRQPQK